MWPNERGPDARTPGFNVLDKPELHSPTEQTSVGVDLYIALNCSGVRALWCGLVWAGLQRGSGSGNGARWSQLASAELNAYSLCLSC